MNTQKKTRSWQGPLFVLLVTADEPQGAQYGGTVAGPYFSNAAARALKYLRETPEVDYETYDANLKMAKKRETERKVRIWAKEREERERRKAGLSAKTAVQSARPVKRNTSYRKSQTSIRRNYDPRKNRSYSMNSRRRG